MKRVTYTPYMHSHLHSVKVDYIKEDKTLISVSLSRIIRCMPGYIKPRIGVISAF